MHDTPVKAASMTYVSHPVVVEDHGDAQSEKWIGNLKLLTPSTVDETTKSHVFHGASSNSPTSASSSTCTSDSSQLLDSDSEYSNNSTSTPNVIYSDKEKAIYSLYQVGDGSEEDPDNIPLRFLEMAQQDRHQALKAARKTVQWRHERGINDMLVEPHVNYDICKQVVPHMFIGRDVEGHVVYVQQPARLNMAQVVSNNITYQDLLRHAIYVQEYVWQIVESDNPRATITSIIDVADLQLSHLRQSDRVQFLKEMAMTFDAHFPMRAHKTFIVNAPKWFHLLYRLVKPLLRKSTRDMIDILTKGKHQDAVLREHLGEATSKALPDFCWSTTKSSDEAITATTVPKMEQELREHVMKQNQAGGQAIKPVLP